MPRKPRIGICVYCGKEGHVTSDHVPPKCLFPPATRVNLITVNACPKCHDAYKLDDEYFRVTLSFRDDLPEGPESRFLREQTRRTLQDPTARAFRAAIRESIVKLTCYSTAGLYLGETGALKYDAIRIQSTAERIIRGLYGKFFGIPLPQDYGLKIILLDLQKDVSVLLDQTVQDVLRSLGENGTRRVFGHVLDIRYEKAIDDENASFWLIELHGAFRFFAFTEPKEGFQPDPFAGKLKQRA